MYKNIDNDCGNEEEFDEETVQQKVMKKIEMIFFNNWFIFLACVSLFSIIFNFLQDNI